MQGTLYGQQSTIVASDSTLHINIEDMVAKYPDWQFPLLKRLSAKPFKSDVKSHKYEWSVRDHRPVKSTVASATVASNATEMYVADPGVFNVDDLIRFPDGEISVVTAVAGGTLLTIERAWGGTTAETLTLGDTVQRIGVASPQGKDADDMVIQGKEDLFNYTQIFEDVVHLSGTERDAMIHGDENSTELIERKQKELMELLQSAIFVGVRGINPQDKRHTLGGIKFFIDNYAPDNAINFGGSSTWSTDASVTTAFEDAIERIADKMGDKPTIYMGYKALRKFRSYDTSNNRGSRTDKKRGLAVVDTYMSQLGELDIVQIRERTGILDDLIFFVDETDVGFKAARNRGWFTEELAKVGDSYKWQVLGEYTVKVGLPGVHSYIYNLGL